VSGCGSPVFLSVAAEGWSVSDAADAGEFAAGTRGAGSGWWLTVREEFHANVR